MDEAGRPPRQGDAGQLRVLPARLRGGAAAHGRPGHGCAEGDDPALRRAGPGAQPAERVDGRGARPAERVGRRGRRGLPPRGLPHRASGAGRVCRPGARGRGGRLRLREAAAGPSAREGAAAHPHHDRGCAGPARPQLVEGGARVLHLRDRRRARRDGHDRRCQRRLRAGVEPHGRDHRHRERPRPRVHRPRQGVLPQGGRGRRHGRPGEPHVLSLRLGGGAAPHQQRQGAGRAGGPCLRGLRRGSAARGARGRRDDAAGEDRQ
mmetsp:Transcript_30169/g.85049  ORF Transcript_30169/g.85049 Transcript_30169/m.85049 type:complete len:264 (+) Transcript_30169:319-1110(+)